jgi:hypothetical protein
MSSTRRIIARAILGRCCSWRFWCKLCVIANLQIRSPLNSLAYIVPRCAKNRRLHQSPTDGPKAWEARTVRRLMPRGAPASGGHA